jgi:hypothetical protein
VADLRETEVARHVVEWLAADGWEVHEEAAVGCGVADIIALRPLPRFRLPLIRRIEVKTSLSVELVAQAVEARRSLCSHTVEVAVPRPRSQRVSSGQRFLREQLRRHQIGVLWVRMEEPNGWHTDDSRVEEDVPRAGLSRAVDRAVGARTDWLITPDRLRWLAALRRTATFCAEHRNIVPAGTNRGGHWTPYKGTMWYVREFLKSHGPATLGEIMAHLAGKHHYRSDALARRAVPANLELYEGDWCEAQRSGKRTTYRIRAGAAAHGEAPR